MPLSISNSGSRSSRRTTMTSKPFLMVLISMVLILVFQSATSIFAQDADKVRVETISAGNGDAVTREFKYSSMVTLYIEEADGSKTPSGWSTRVSDGATADKPFDFQPGVGLIEGWTEGVLKMKEGERAWLHVPARLGYGDRPMGSPGGAFYIPASSNLLFDIEILGKAGKTEL
ncbi:peptidylprolyl isomerase FKBP-type [Nitzschia inconspicua]|uniref:peptidylprolyl isomerase n=1 Tax=Nitzschia inconspicua TaxID=303405 RepID=A0A9K3KU90_9STRA|nr:peptidylprolyl isomerase FKBP-type [Nitzschia inconspicua]KAG7374378.1 peptidylprolyl isomerase FKBP-type [Nitzschia inconspicua]